MNKEEKIYINLIDGINVLVPVKALKIDNDYYKIINNHFFDNGDTTSIWEFFCDDIVKCKLVKDKKIAYKLIESNLLNRHLYTLIFNIVSNHRTKNIIKINNLDLINLGKIPQSTHPIFKKWLFSNQK